MPAAPLLALSLLSAAALGYEILLMRLFSIILWHHFAYMMISVALLGYGAAGAMVALAQRWLAPRFAAVFVGGAILFGVSAVASFALAQRVAFDPLEILWDPQQPLRLLLIYLLLFVPFFCAATSVCLTFTRFNDQIPRIYSFDIVGAGLGSLAVIVALFALAPRSGAGMHRVPLASTLVAGAVAGSRSHFAGQLATRLDRATAVRVQGIEPGPAHQGRARGRRKLEPAGARHGGGKLFNSVPPRAWAKPQRDHGATTSIGSLYRW